MTTLQEVEKAINDLGYGTPEYHEALAFYFMTLARSQWRHADLLHNAKMKRQHRSRRAVADDDRAAGEV
jgi:hypothetical protein